MNCTKCRNELKFVIPENIRSADTHQFEFAINLVFGDGYGMFTDHWDRPIIADLCHDCMVNSSVNSH